MHFTDDMFKQAALANAERMMQHFSIPQTLYKYRPFDKYALDMLENEYLYLCAAKNLDDPSECTVSFDLQSVVDQKTNQLMPAAFAQMLDVIKPYTAEENIERTKEMLMTSDGRVVPDWNMRIAAELEAGCAGENVAALMSLMQSFVEVQDDHPLRPQLESLVSIAANARDEMGICSLTVLADSAEMWNNYTNDGTGYCIEFDMCGYEYNGSVFPVLYDDHRANNLVMTVVADVMSLCMNAISGGQISADRSKYIEMFLTKETKWQYQKEWRILGNANQKIKAPPIKAIYLGRNMSDENKRAMQQVCEKCNIVCIEK